MLEDEVEEIPADLADLAEEWRQKLVDVLSNFDDVIMEKYVGEETITVDDLRKALRKGTIANQVVPVLCGSAFKNKGVQPLLDGVIDYLPSPLDVPPVEGKTLEGEPVTRPADENGPLSALAFKVQSDPHVGKLT